MPSTNNSLFRPYGLKLLGTYSLTTIEFLLELMYPFTIGVAINGLLAGQGIISVMPLVVVWVSQLLVGAIYQMVSARVVASIYRSLATKVTQIPQPLTDDLEISSTSKMSARVDMVEKICEALADVVPLFLSGLVGIIGSIGFLFLYDVRAGWIALGLVGTIAIIQLGFGKRVLVINEQLNNQRESQVHLIESRDKSALANHFRAITRFTIGFKDLEAGTWSLSDVVSLGAVLAVLYIITQGGLYNPGSIYAAITYIMTLSDSLEHAPTLVDEWAHFTDVTDRIKNELV